ncbi:MAG: hypothetical protein N4A65_00285 [Cohaesibacter sp.]|jgi:hypothetical protein|nr:hypothetical protein [Cohaesibacter sp.]
MTETVKHFVDVDGAYIGQFDGVEPPEGSVEVPSGPDDGRQKWKNGKWEELQAEEKFENLTSFQFGVILDLLAITEEQVFKLIDELNWSDMEKIIAKRKVRTGGNDGRWSRSNPLWDLLGPKLGIDAARIDEEWRKAQAL